MENIKSNSKKIFRDPIIPNSGIKSLISENKTDLNESETVKLNFFKKSKNEINSTNSNQNIKISNSKELNNNDKANINTDKDLSNNESLNKIITNEFIKISKQGDIISCVPYIASQENHFLCYAPKENHSAITDSIVNEDENNSTKGIIDHSTTVFLKGLKLSDSLISIMNWIKEHIEEEIRPYHIFFLTTDHGRKKPLCLKFTTEDKLKKFTEKVGNTMLERSISFQTFSSFKKKLKNQMKFNGTNHKGNHNYKEKNNHFNKNENPRNFFQKFHGTQNKSQNNQSNYRSSHQHNNNYRNIGQNNSFQNRNNFENNNQFNKKRKRDNNDIGQKNLKKIRTEN